MTISSNSYNIAELTRKADLLIGAVLIHGAKAPKLVTESMVKTMEAGSVIVDVAIDQGGCVETCDHVTTHSNPPIIKHGVVHYSVANMPGAVARTSTLALTNATLPYALQIAGRGWKAMAKENAGFAKGINVTQGHLTYQAVADALKLPYTELTGLL